MELAGELHMLEQATPCRLASQNLMCILWVLLTAMASSIVVCLPLLAALLSQESIFFTQEGMRRCTNES